MHKIDFSRYIQLRHAERKLVEASILLAKGQTFS